MSYLLGIDGGPHGVDTCQHFLMQQGGNAVGRVVDEPILNGSSPVAQLLWTTGLLHGELREMSDAIGYQLSTLGSVQPSLLVKELIHIHTLQLGNASRLRHPVVEFVYLLFHVFRFLTTGQKQSEAHHGLPCCT